MTVTNSGTQFVGNNNEALQWESTLDVNVGVDFGFNNDRFNGSFNLYRKETTDLLLLSTLAAPQVPGIETIFQNLTDGKVVVFDEPTESLDLEGSKLIYKILNDYRTKSKTILIASHDPNIIKGAGAIIDLSSKPIPRVGVRRLANKS